MASPPVGLGSTEAIRRSGGGKSKTSVKREPFDHLIQHIKQTDPMLYEALKRLFNLGEEVTNFIESDQVIPGQHKEIRMILPGVQTPLADVADNRYRVTIGDKKKINLLRTESTVKSAAPSGGPWTCDILRSIDQSGSFQSLYNAGDIPTILAGDHRGTHKIFAIKTLFDGDELRYDIILGNGANNLEIVLVGILEDK